MVIKSKCESFTNVHYKQFQNLAKEGSQNEMQDGGVEVYANYKLGACFE